MTQRKRDSEPEGRERRTPATGRKQQRNQPAKAVKPNAKRRTMILDPQHQAQAQTLWGEDWRGQLSAHIAALLTTETELDSRGQGGRRSIPVEARTITVNEDLARRARAAWGRKWQKRWNGGGYGVLRNTERRNNSSDETVTLAVNGARAGLGEEISKVAQQHSVSEWVCKALEEKLRSINAAGFDGAEIEIDVEGGLIDGVRVCGRLDSLSKLRYRVLNFDVEGVHDEEIAHTTDGRAHTKSDGDTQREGRSADPIG